MADPEVEAAVRLASFALGLCLVIAALVGMGLAPAAGATAFPGAASSPVVGNLSGPSLLATASNATYYLNASGGPAFEDGVFVGRIDWNASLVGPNVTGISVSPSSGTIVQGTSQPVELLVTTGPASETLTLSVRLTSITNITHPTNNGTAVLTRNIQVVAPYVLRATLVAASSAAILPFNVTVALDGTIVGKVAIPGIAAGTTYQFTYRYPSAGLGSGYHTFVLSVADPHGLVTFSNGLTVESTTFYVAPASTSYTVWYVIGIVAFFGVLFIYASRVAARRRGVARR